MFDPLVNEVTRRKTFFVYIHKPALRKSTSKVKLWLRLLHEHHVRNLDPYGQKEEREVLADVCARTLHCHFLNLEDRSKRSKASRRSRLLWILATIRSKVVEALADALCKNTASTFLKFSKNNLGSEGETDALCINIALTSLNLCQKTLGSEEGKALADALCNFARLP
ncbi:hypothetical protein C2G38_2176650 [Gigaspora rosea]|uniref:Uncharacterized protein n=1 Tax=Gigaspora rosea TaxID=44941 RepID=A0A397VI12_9GLOM|nr:hypothetical protein C2G38_2234603 [Gigaspora rosea]RIB21441.1 hypothetical protein C2G38_2176650 [Gigaspora rosea]